MRADEFGAKVVRRIDDHESKPQTRSAFKRLRHHLPNANPAVEMRPSEFLGELKKREQRVGLLASLEFA